MKSVSAALKLAKIVVLMDAWDIIVVLNKRGKPLMPCSPAKARLLLKEKKAIVVRRTPFTIQLTIATGESKQPVSLGVDA